MSQGAAAFLPLPYLKGTNYMRWNSSLCEMVILSILHNIIEKKCILIWNLEQVILLRVLNVSWDFHSFSEYHMVLYGFPPLLKKNTVMPSNSCPRYFKSQICGICAVFKVWSNTGFSNLICKIWYCHFMFARKRKIMA